MAILSYRVSGLGFTGAPRGIFTFRPFGPTISLTWFLSLGGPWRGGFDNPQDYQRLQTNDVGVNIIVQILDQFGIPVVIPPTTQGMEIKLLNPDKTSADFAARFLTDGTDGQIFFTTEPGALAQGGLYFLQAKLGTLSTGLGRLWVSNNIDNN